MARILLVFSLLISTSSFAVGTQGHVSIGIADVGQLSQQDNGQIILTETQPQQCEEDNQGNITCDF